jgi:plasmid maintenance system antidote protein VapI
MHHGWWEDSCDTERCRGCSGCIGTALRFYRYFGTSEKFWINLQTLYNIELQKDVLGDRLEKEVVLLSQK